MVLQITIPGKPFARSAEALRQDLILKRMDLEVEEFPVARIFDFIRLSESNLAAQKKLARRGSFVRSQSDDARFHNRARRSFSERLKVPADSLDRTSPNGTTARHRRRELVEPSSLPPTMCALNPSADHCDRLGSTLATGEAPVRFVTDQAGIPQRNANEVVEEAHVLTSFQARQTPRTAP